MIFSTELDRADTPVEHSNPVDVAADETLLDTSLPDRLRHVEAQIIIGALRQSRGIQAEAARRLGISRSNLHYRIRKLGIEQTGVEYSARKDG